MRSIRQLGSLAGRRAVVTGGAGHIGLAIGETLIELGARVAILDRDERACRSRVRELARRRSGSAFAVVCDLADEARTRAAAREAIRVMGGLDVLIHAAAFVGDTRLPGWAAAFPKQTASAFEAALRVNLTSAFILAQECRHSLERSTHGSIILFSSIYGTVAPDFELYKGTSMANPAGYGASKGGLQQLARHLAAQLAPHVRVNTISPGGVLRGQPAVFRSRYVRRAPLRRMAREEDLKGAVAYLASDLSSYVTGHDLRVDGGWTAW
jgi:NAD(P)-dependent dehydrogenase (short-subunit alcohol dehydrogenase family)